MTKEQFNLKRVNDLKSTMKGAIGVLKCESATSLYKDHITKFLRKTDSAIQELLTFISSFNDKEATNSTI